jgi:hypothetical protein
MPESCTSVPPARYDAQSGQSEGLRWPSKWMSSLGKIMDRVFVIQQIGKKDSPERARADEIYNYIIAPAVQILGLEPYRADLDLTPGAITPRMLSELLSARLVIADLTGRNPNVFYELGITHSFVRPLISIADSASTLPFDAKDEKIIELGDYPSVGLGFAQGRQAQTALEESLKIVLADDYSPPSPLREMAANASVDRLVPDDPVAAEMAQMRETLEEIRKNVTPRAVVPLKMRSDISALRRILEINVGYLDQSDFAQLAKADNSFEQTEWVDKTLIPLAIKLRNRPAPNDPWASDSKGGDGYSDEPPF